MELDLAIKLIVVFVKEHLKVIHVMKILLLVNQVINHATIMVNVTHLKDVNATKDGQVIIVKKMKLYVLHYPLMKNVQEWENATLNWDAFVVMDLLVITVRKRVQIVEKVSLDVQKMENVIKKQDNASVNQDLKDFNVNKLTIKEDVLVNDYLV